MTQYKIIAIGASAGGVETLKQLVKGLPADLPAAVFVVLHLSPYSSSALPIILSRAGSLKAVHPEDGETIQPGKIYVAPPNRHLLIESGLVRLSYGPKENGTRPAVDPLFRTAAAAYGNLVIGVVLSGTLDNGTVGLLAIKRCGGIAIVQDPEEALYESMPRNAIANVEVDRILSVTEIPLALAHLAQQPVTTESTSISESEIAAEKSAANSDFNPWSIKYGSKIAELEKMTLNSEQRPGKSSEFVCPDCGGVLWAKEIGNLLHFRCRTGHAYSETSLLVEQSERLEAAMWAGYRALLESASLYRRLARRARQQQIVERYEQQAQTAEQHGELIRQILANGLNRKKE